MLYNVCVSLLLMLYSRLSVLLSPHFRHCDGNTAKCCSIINFHALSSNAECLGPMDMYFLVMSLFVFMLTIGLFRFDWD